MTNSLKKRGIFVILKCKAQETCVDEAFSYKHLYMELTGNNIWKLTKLKYVVKGTTKLLWRKSMYVQVKVGDTKSVLALTQAGLNRACFSMPTTQVATENNEQTAATEAAHGLSSCQGMIIHNFCREEFDSYYRTGMMYVPHSSSFLSEEFNAITLLIVHNCKLSIMDSK